MLSSRNKVIIITKLHEGLVSRQIHDVGKVIQVRNEEVFVYDSKLKKKKLNTPVKGKEVCRALSFAASHNQDQNEGCENKQFELHNTDESKNVPDSNDMTENFEQISGLLSAVLQTLQEEGQLETFMKFNNLLALQEFPTKTYATFCFLI